MLIVGKTAAGIPKLIIALQFTGISAASILAIYILAVIISPAFYSMFVSKQVTIFVLLFLQAEKQKKLRILIEKVSAIGKSATVATKQFL